MSDGEMLDTLTEPSIRQHAPSIPAVELVRYNRNRKNTVSAVITLGMHDRYSETRIILLNHFLKKYHEMFGLKAGPPTGSWFICHWPELRLKRRAENPD